MLRKDGKYTFYKIQHQWSPTSEWVYSSYVDYAKTNSETCDSFTASGNCWQLIGEHGVFDIRNARTGLKHAKEAVVRDFVANKLPRVIELRLVRITVTQTTEFVE